MECTLDLQTETKTARLSLLLIVKIVANCNSGDHSLGSLLFIVGIGQHKLFNTKRHAMLK